MKTKEFASTLVFVFGLYLIYQAIILGGIPLTSALVSVIVSGQSNYGVSALMIGFPSFLFIFLFGISVLLSNQKIGVWISNKTCSESEAKNRIIGSFDKEELTVLAFTLLGLFMLIQTVPAAIWSLSNWVQTQLWNQHALNDIGKESARHFTQTLPGLIFHLTSIGFSLFVFLKGKDLNKFLELFRRVGTKVEPVAGGDRPR